MLWLDDAMLRILIGCGLGLIAGSFLGAIVTRWPRGESVVRGRSLCDACGRTLAVVELIPIFSALMSRGRCRGCGARIDPAHLIMELGSALIGGLVFWAIPMPAALLIVMALWMLLALAVLDARHLWLPDSLTLPLAVLGLTLGDWILPAPLWDRVIGAVVGYVGFFLLAVGYRRLRGRDGLGLGDAKLLGAIGAWLGWMFLPMVLLIASLGALLWAAMQKLRGRAVDTKTKIPLGTFLCVAAVVTAFLGWSIRL
jgi:leader peptidase (prepilin peptidase)/N-methyltransferase